MSENRPEDVMSQAEVRAALEVEMNVGASAETAAVEGGGPKPSVGERLRAAREAMGLDTATVAATLKLSGRQIDALESGDWSRLPGNTFIRGFVRNYARVVRLDPGELVADLDAPLPMATQLDLPQTTTAVLPQPGNAQKRDYATVLAGIVLVAIAVVAYYVVPPDFWQSRPQGTAPVIAAAPAPAPAFPPPGAAGDPAMPPPAVNEAATPVVPPNAPVPAVEPAAPPTATATATPSTADASPVAAASGKGLKLVFSQPSWVEVRDRSGQIIFSELNPAGSAREIDGQPPFSLVVGNATHVSVRYRGREIVLQPRSRDDVARVTVE